MPDVRKERVASGSKGGPNTGAAVAESGISPPTVSLPKGGGAIRGIGEKFAANPVTGTGSLTVPIFASPARSGFGPQLSLSYDSGAGNGPFGLGWNLSLPAITRKTDKGLPRYKDATESDVFILSGSEDLVPELTYDQGQWKACAFTRTINNVSYRVQRYRPRIEGLFASIERWTDENSGEAHWRSISKDNITTLYGKTSESRIANPSDTTHIFSWLICESYDDKGNAIVYVYLPEDSVGVDTAQAHERNRTDKSREANRYIKRIKYGNLKSRLVEPELSAATWLFELVFDYGEGHFEELPVSDGHQFVLASKDPGGTWPTRTDPFSTYRAGFEVRTYRLCRRVLMFHNFPDELGTDDYLVRSTEFTYDESHVASFITSITQSGHVRRDDGTYLSKSLPPLALEYTKATVQDEIHEITPGSIKNLPVGLDGDRYQWVDIDGEGLSGILSAGGDAWFYKPNLGDGHFGSIETLRTLPAVAKSTTARHQFLDLAGDGRLDVVQFGGPVPGFYERTEGNDWNSLRAFTSLPALNWADPNLRFVDLTGDGHADILITEDSAFTWLHSLAEEGFSASESISQALDEEKGPKLVFADPTQSIYLADMSGDGMTDLVRIRNGEVCYWPNLGYGRFGAKVAMDDAPWLDAPDQFDQKRIRLADIDGSGNNDIIYLGRDKVRLYFNQSGNSWTKGQALTQFPQIDNLSSVTAVDLLGNGTACLVWSSPLPAEAHQPMRYLDLMGGQKPHLLVSIINNLGAETRISYAASTRFYLADKAEGRPWVTRLPYPVHVVERVETLDRISRNRFVTRYAYHHGYFDGAEREFRGFGLLEQWDTEEFATLSASDTLADATNVDAASHTPPVLTRTWYHTGAWLEGGLISKQFEREYYTEGDLSLNEGGLSKEQLQAMQLDDTLLPTGVKLQDASLMPWDLSPEEIPQACRALKGSILRQEVYALDGTEQQDRPYSVSERNYTIDLLQPREANRHAVFFVCPREAIDFHYERKLSEVGDGRLADPRVSHSMTISTRHLRQRNTLVLHRVWAQAR